MCIPVGFIGYWAALVLVFLSALVWHAGIDWVKRRAGGGVVVLEISPEQVEDRFDDALRWYVARRMCAFAPNFVKVSPCGYSDTSARTSSTRKNPIRKKAGSPWKRVPS